MILILSDIVYRPGISDSGSVDISADGIALTISAILGKAQLKIILKFLYVPLLL